MNHGADYVDMNNLLIINQKKVLCEVSVLWLYENKSLVFGQNCDIL